MNNSLDLLKNLFYTLVRTVFVQTPPFVFIKSSINVLFGVEITSHSLFPRVLFTTHVIQSSLSVVKLHLKLPAVNRYIYIYKYS